MQSQMGKSLAAQKNSAASPRARRAATSATITYGYDAGMSQSRDRHAYGMNNPLRYIDPSGHTFMHQYLINMKG
jgi:hypothetical protein